MTYLFPKKYFGFLFLLLSISVYSQDPPPLGCPGIDLGTVTASCANPVQTLVADYYDIGESTSYRVDAIPYAPPFPYTGGSGSTNITQDDRWSELISLGFDFCFFGGAYSKALVSSNGSITFSIAGEVPGGLYSPNSNAGWSFSDPIPGNNGSTADPRAVLGIFGVLQDTDPSNSGPTYDPNNQPVGWSINYEIAGEAPCRRLVFNIYKLGQYQCGQSVGPQTYQMVLYEGTNVIEVYVEDRTPCMSWNSGNGLIGIQNADATVAYTPSGRNTGAWTATNEAWRFTPNGPSIVTIEWLDENGIVLHTGETFTVNTEDIVYDENNPDDGWKVRATYATCYGDIVIDNPIILGSSDIDLGPDIETCSTDDIVLDANPSETPGLSFTWSKDGNLIPNADQSTYTITAPNSGVYSVEVNNNDGCIETGSIEITFNQILGLNHNPDALAVCDTDNDGYAAFNLHDADIDILNGLNLDVTYHATFLNAELGLYELFDGYINDDPYIDVVFARVDDPATGCFTVIELVLVVNLMPDAPTVEFGDLIVCDDGDGEAIFDLTINTPFVYDQVLNPNFIITFHILETDAEDSIYPIVNTVSFSSTGQTIWVRVENDQTGCTRISNFELIVEELPQILQPINLFEIDDNGDGFAIFDLTENDAVVSGGHPDSIVSYYETEADAQIDLNAIANPMAYQNITNPQTIFVRLDNMNGNCFEIASFIISVEFLSVDSFGFEDLNIFPNPSEGNVTIQSSELVSETTIALYDILGKRLFSKKSLPQNGSVTLDVSSFESGVYFIKISSEGNEAVRKLIRK